MAAVFFSRSAATHNPTFLAFPVMMLFSVAVTAAARRGPNRAGVSRPAASTTSDTWPDSANVSVKPLQHNAYHCLGTIPTPTALWTLIGGPRMWERRPADPDFCRVRIGVGTMALATRLVAPETPPVERSDPVTAAALQRLHRNTFHDRRRTGHDPTAWHCHSDGRWGSEPGPWAAPRDHLPAGRPARAGPVADRRRDRRSKSGPLGLAEMAAAQPASGRYRRGGDARMVYRSLAEAEGALVGARSAHVVVIADAESAADCCGG